MTSSRRVRVVLIPLLAVMTACGVITPAPGVGPGSAPVVARPGGDSAGDPYFPQLGNTGYDAEHYAIELTYDPATGSINALVEITAVATEYLSSYNLDLSGLTVTSVTVDGLPTRYVRTPNQPSGLGPLGELTIRPEVPIGIGRRFLTVIGYHGVPQALTNTAPPGQPGWNRTASGGAYVVSEPDGASTWFPVNDHPTDKATYVLRITAPPQLSVAANGTLVETKTQPNAKTWIWELDDPMASYLATVVIGDLVPIDGAPAPDGTPVRHYAPSRLAPEARAAFARTGEMIGVLANTFGPYPFDSYGAVVVDRELGFALETQTLSVFGRDLVAGDGRYEHIVLHELAHQWFGNHLSLTRWEDIWLNEGFATYSEVIWSQATDPSFDADAWARQVIARGYGRPGDPGRDDLFAGRVYFRGALTLHALRRELGDPAFFTVMRTWIERHGQSDATTAQFIDVAERVAGYSLDQFFQAWLYAPTAPALP